MTTLYSCLAGLALACAAAFVRRNFARQLLLLAASYLFYQIWGLPFLAILIASSVVNFGLGAWLRKRASLGRLWIGIVVNVGLLCFFKYLPALPGAGDLAQRIVMPAGMSFWTFQALSYLFDIYREEEMDPSLVEFCLYMAFWPTVLMGPICRMPKMLPQFRKMSGLLSENVVSGLKRVGMGLFMKLILAQLLTSTLGRDFDETGRNLGGLDVWFLAIGFGFQLFFDFAGYSNIVIGAAKVFGFQLEENFDSPYLSTSPAVFWTRWHMSLSSWIRDYVFVPVATLRRATWWRYVALILSMTLFGLWHGPKLTFVLWGAYQGAFLATHRVVQQNQRKFNISINGLPGDLIGWGVTFLGISLGWILFRAKDAHQAFAMFGAIFSPASYREMQLPGNFYRLSIALVAGYFACNVVLNSRIFQSMAASMQKTNDNPRFLQLCWINRWWALTPPILMLFAIAALILLHTSKVTPFMYSAF